ncbi:DNA repair protein RAD50 [Silene latifolia]|uniref:DNA repair protein RAD50 n=1 Tax=Silene latifolia TaxID=37657 RepID=UPI003D772E41
MSTVDKMLIKGIRSFDPENKHVITFFKPLTLIVGSNGAGKTTIIECLKLSCTGELPPNARSGQSFIHDPKVAGETETKAQIKLRFKTAAGKDVVCIRSFQLTQKASKMEYKAIESVLQTINPNTGEKVCLSYRCADMDREIPALMGVSKAILENVIFVHQDEANWPLQDSSTLKKKFDDIFSATRYTKALEVIKKLHKEQAQEIKTYKLKLEHLQTLKDSAYKFRESIAQDQERTESLKIDMQDLERETREVDDKIRDTELKLKHLQKLQNQITEKSASRAAYLTEQEELYAKLDEDIEDSDEELKVWKQKFDENIAQKDAEISKLRREGDDLEKKSKALEDNRTEYIVEISKLEAEANAHVSLKKDRDSIIENLFAKHNLGSLPCGPLSDELALSYTSRLKKRMSDLETDLQEKKRLNENEMDTVWDRYKKAESHQKDLEAKKKAAQGVKIGILERIQKTENERENLENQISDVDLSSLDEKEKKMQLELEKKTNQIGERNFDSNVDKKQTEMFKIDQKIKVLSRERDILAGDSEDKVKLSLKKSELENLKKKLKKIIDDHKDKIKAVLKGRLPPDREWKMEITKALRLIREEFDFLTQKSHEAEKEVNMVQLKIAEVSHTLNEHHKNLEYKKRSIESKIRLLDLKSFEAKFYGIDSYIKVLEEAKDRRDDLKSLSGEASGMRRMYEQYQNIARKHHSCPCCDRPFSPEEEDAFVEKHRNLHANSGKQMTSSDAKSSSADSIFEQLDTHRIVYEEYVQLSKETIPQADTKLADLKGELDPKMQALDDILGTVAQVKADKDSIEGLVPQVEIVDRYFKDIQTIQKHVDELEEKLDSRGQAVRSMEEVQTEINTLQSTRDLLQKDIDKLREEQRYMESDLHIAEIRMYSAREEKMKAVVAVNALNKAEKDLESLMDEKNQIEIEDKQLVEAIVPSARETQKLLSNYNNLKERLTKEYDDQAELLRSQGQDVEELHRLNSKITLYNEAEKDKRLKERQVKKSEREFMLQNCNQRKKEIADALQSAVESKKSQESVRRNIDDNIKYRNYKSKVDNLTHELETLEQKQVEIGSSKVIEADILKLNQERDRLLSELNRCRGTMSVYESNISKNKIDLKQPQYKDIDKRYVDQLIQLKTAEMANKDLDRYYNALDKALMRFHSMKMEEINKIIRELWQQTYRGQDIDYIYIHSDSEGAGTRSYSYKVLMQSGDAELEMRGRCSAGQKVLASLIIRLALAETFCLHCGILALDEPTTNLDGPNSESLAAALLRIMEDRKGQENFQLIVITHDERFAQLIGQRQHAEKYYRVHKDEHQHSIIAAQEIFD